MATRYNGNQPRDTSIFNNDSLREVIEERDVKSINHYSINLLKYPTVSQIKSLSIISHIWSSKDKYWKLSETYYGDSKYWWVIAWFNKKPIEATLQYGDTVLIPQPLSNILGML